MIQQQYYTRGKRSIYSNTPGYGTVAKSRGLSDKFVKNVLEPFCYYDTPIELVAAGEKNPDRYPDMIVSFSTEGGDRIVGRTVFIGADYTGQRNTFFTHHFVIPKELKGSFIEEPRKLLNIEEFAFHHDIETEMELPELEDIHYSRRDNFYTKKEQLFHRLKITDEVYKKLIYALFEAVAHHKKVYISLNEDAALLSKYSKDLMKFILASLPYDVRNHLGFITYGKEPLGKKNIHLMFVERASIKDSNVEIQKSFTFDFSTDKFLNVDFEVKNHPYLTFITSNLQIEPLIKEFFNYVETVLEDVKEDEKLDVSIYDTLCTFYEVEKNPQTASFALSKYMRDKISSAVDIDRLLREISLLCRTSVKLLKYEVFQSTSIEKICELIREKQLTPREVIEIKDFFVQVPEYCRDPKERNVYIAYSERAKAAINEQLLITLEIEKLTEEDILALDLSLEYAINLDKYQFLFYLQKLIRDDNLDIEVFNGIFRSRYFEPSKGMLKRIFTKDLQQGKFERSLLAFTQNDLQAGVTCDFEGLMEFLVSEKGTGKVHEFIRWFSKSYAQQTEKVQEDFEDALRKYFIKQEPNALKNKKVKERLLRIREPRVVQVLEELEYQCSGKFRRIVLKIGKIINNKR